MNFRFLGGGNEVGRVGILVDDKEKKILFDYGLTPESPPLYPLTSPPVNNLFLSHAHLDHSGMLPWIAGTYNVDIYATSVSKAISFLLFRDAIKIADVEGHPFPYTKRDVEKAKKRFIDITYGDTVEVNGLNCSFHSAGHIPGSVMFEINDTTLITGDLNTIDTQLTKGAKPVPVETLFIEGTYSGANHPIRKKLVKEFIDKIDDVLRNKGTAIIPAFAVGRAQEIALILHDLGYEIWLDGMGKKISEIFLKYPEYLRNPSKLKNAIAKTNMVYSNHNRKQALDGEIIITTSGMLEGGPVLWYINKIAEDPKSAIILTGYQVEGTNGRMLLENRSINLHGVTRKVNCQVDYYDFSAHAGHDQLVNFARSCRAKKVVIYHSDDPGPLAEEIKDFAEVYIPQSDEIIEI